MRGLSAVAAEINTKTIKGPRTAAQQPA